MATALLASLPRGGGRHFAKDAEEQNCTAALLEGIHAQIAELAKVAALHGAGSPEAIIAAASAAILTQNMEAMRAASAPSLAPRPWAPSFMANDSSQLWPVPEERPVTAWMTLSAGSGANSMNSSMDFEEDGMQDEDFEEEAPRGRFALM